MLSRQLKSKMISSSYILSTASTDLLFQTYVQKLIPIHTKIIKLCYLTSIYVCFVIYQSIQVVGHETSSKEWYVVVRYTHLRRWKPICRALVHRLQLSFGSLCADNLPSCYGFMTRVYNTSWRKAEHHIYEIKTVHRTFGHHFFFP